MYPERGEGVFVLGIVLVALSAVVLGLRFWSRALLPGQKFGSDDWMIPEEKALPIIKHAFDNGLNTWDTVRKPVPFTLQI